MPYGLLRCPLDGGDLRPSSDGERLDCEFGGHDFPIESGLPRLFVANGWTDARRDVTDIALRENSRNWLRYGPDDQFPRHGLGPYRDRRRPVSEFPQARQRVSRSLFDQQRA